METPQTTKAISFNNFKGLNSNTDPSLIDNSESADMLNIIIDSNGTINKRTGYDRYVNSNQNSPINGHYIFTRRDGFSIELVAISTNLYWVTNSDEGIIQLSAPIYTSLSDSKITFITFNDKLFIFDGTKVIVYDGNTSPIMPTPYIPTITISMSSNGSGTTNEDFNLLGNKFKCSYSANGTDTVFQLTLKNLDSTTVTASFDGGVNFDKVEGTHLSVDRTNGKVTFTSAPPSGTNNLIIVAGYTDQTKQNMIKNAKIAVLYGGSNDTRIVLSGNKDYPNRVWRSGLYDGSYWPENKFTDVGSSNERIMGFSKQYDTLVVLKEHTVWLMGFDINNGEPIYTTKPINEEFGCFASDSIQIINNNPVWFDKYKGVVVLTQSNVRDERNITVLSDKINNKLLQENNLEQAVSADYDFKYFLIVNNKAYIYDYRARLWMIWDNIPARTFIIKDSLYFGSNTTGIIYRMKKNGELYEYQDDGQPINSYWYSKLFDFNTPYMRKTVNKIFYSLKPYQRSSATLTVINDKLDEKILGTTRMDLMSFAPFYFDPVSFVSNSLPQSIRIKSKIKKIVYFQIKFSNNALDEAMGITSISFEITIQSYVK